MGSTSITATPSIEVRANCIVLARDRDGELAARKRFGVHRRTLHPAKTHEPPEELAVEPVPVGLALEVLLEQPDLLDDRLLVQRDEDVRSTQVAIVLRDLVLEDEMVAKRVPRQLGRQPMILMEVVPRVREDD